MADTVVGRWDELASRLEAVERRLASVERALAEGRPPMRPVPPVRAWELPTAAGMTPPPLPEGLAGLARTTAGGAERPVALPAQPAAPAPTSKTAEWADLESRIGRNWTSWVGGIVLVLGTFFFLQYAWEQGWLRLSPQARVVAAVGLGIGLVGAGAWTNRRGMRVLAGTLTGAGVAIAMAAFFAGHTMFEPPVLSSRAALLGVCAAAGVGIWRGVRINAVSVAIIALLGAYLGPFVLRSGRDQSLALMAYLGAVGVVAWGLAYLRPRWPAVRWFAWTCTVLWMAAWTAAYPVRGEHKALGVGAIAFFLAGFVGEAFFTLHRAYRVRDENDESSVPGFVAAVENSLATLSLLTTAAAFGGFYAILDKGFGGRGAAAFHLDPVAAIAIGLAAVHGMIALATPSRQFARAGLLAAAGLVTLAVPLAFGQVAITLAWLVLAVALAALGWRRANRALRIWCTVLLALAIGRLFTFDLADRSLRAPRWVAGEQGVSPWLLLAWGTAVFAHVVGWLCKPVSSAKKKDSDGPKPLTGWGAIVAATGTVVFLAATGVDWTGSAWTLMGVLWAAAIVALSPWAGGLGYVPHAAAALAVVGGKWFLLDGFGPAADGWEHAGKGVPVLNAVAGTGAALIALGAWVTRQLRGEARQIGWVAVAGLAFAWLNFETLRFVDYTHERYADFVTAKQVALSMLWGVVGLAAVVAGFAREWRPLRYAALGLLGLTLGKILFVDLAQVRPVYRILSFVAVGALLLCVSFVYHRHEADRQGGRA